LGIPENRDFNGRTQEGAGTYQVTQLNGKRWGAADAFVRPVHHRPNLTVLTRAHARRIVVEAGRATAVEFVASGRLARARAAAEVIVSGGAINSPKLLQLSGIGPADALRRLGIPVVVHLPGVGQNLHDHLNVQVITRCRRPITYDHWHRPLRFVKFGFEYLLFSRGVATSNRCEGGAFLRSSERVPTPDIQLHFMPLIWLNYGRTEVEGHGMTLEATFLRPESRGSVTLASADPLLPPLIDPRYCTERPDVDVLVTALKRCRQIMETRALRGLASRELYPGPEARSDDDLERYVRQSGTTAYHPVGTCRMGRDDAAVVDSRLRVRGLSALRVVDSSVMPSIVSGSTQAPSMMIGEVAAGMILEDR
jgi:choline dehydrogenase-like flavoprotein